MVAALRLLIAVACLASLAACLPRNGAARSANAFSFALLGDAPYRVADEGRVAALLDEINDDPSLRFALHVGDLKGSDEPCTDALLQQRVAQFERVRTALVYTPGDNEWTDCHRPAAGRFNPLERLAALRRLAFADPQRSFGQRPLVLRSQADSDARREFVENATFEHGGVVFVSLHVVGSNNGLDPWDGIDREDRPSAARAERIAEFRRRQQANLAWLRFAFARAEANRSSALVILMQANPRFELGAGSRQRAGFDALIDELARLARRFGRPVLLAHGDRHVYLVDRPLADAQPPVPLLRRVQTFGNPWLFWVRVDVDPEHDEVFEIRPGTPPANR